MPQNLAAWALASAWRGMALYPLAGTIRACAPFASSALLRNHASTNTCA
ncbi:hypothetical protein ACIRRI_49510 [Streptomyces mirabilis]